ncbi:MAG: TonB-dependent receptor [Chitinophagaceae bacterium]|nr:TonB-dependent receptor [Chitinophagaceae bacterium]
MSGGVRYDTRNLDVKNLMDGNDVKEAGFNKSFGNFSGSIGLAAQVTKQLNLKLNIARGFRAPSIPELASNGAHEGTIRYEYGDNNLKSETSTQIDGGAEFNTEHVSLNIAAFYNSFSNFVFYRKLEAARDDDSTIYIDGQQLAAFKFGQTNATLTGIEASLDIHPHPLDWLHIENTFSFTTGKLKEAIESSTYLPFIPASRLINELRCNFAKLTKGITNFYAKLELDNTFAQQHIFAAYNTETDTPGYSLLNAGMGADIVSAKGKTLFSIHFNAMNLGDVAYQNHLSRLKYTAENLATGRTGVFNMGRNFSIKLNIPFSTYINKK